MLASIDSNDGEYLNRARDFLTSLDPSHEDTVRSFQFQALVLQSKVSADQSKLLSAVLDVMAVGDYHYGSAQHDYQMLIEALPLNPAFVRSAVVARQLRRISRSLRSNLNPQALVAAVRLHHARAAQKGRRQNKAPLPRRSVRLGIAAALLGALLVPTPVRDVVREFAVHWLVQKVAH